MTIRSRIVCLIFLPALVILGISCQSELVPFDEASAVYSEVSGENAYRHVAALVGFGPRPTGTEALEKSRQYLVEELKKTGWTAQRQSFRKTTPEGEMEFVNLRARFGGEESWSRSPVGLLCSHYDTKRFSFEFVGANDSGSSTGLLLELARVLAKRPAIAEKIELVFFDGEEALGTNITATDGLYGSRYFASQMLLLASKKRPKWGVLLDMVGDKNLNVRAATQLPGTPIQDMKKNGSNEMSVDLEKVKKSLEGIARKLLLAAEDMDVRKEIGITSDFILDDHIPLTTGAGIPTIDIIDFDYGSNWHTPGDTLDKISAQSLQTVGRVTMLLIEKYLLGQAQKGGR